MTTDHISNLLDLHCPRCGEVHVCIESEWNDVEWYVRCSTCDFYGTIEEFGAVRVTAV